MTLLGNAKSGERYYETGGFLLSSEEYRPPFLFEKDGASLQSCISQQSHVSRPSPIMQFQNYMWIIEEAKAAQRLDL
jgi:hypothetical protein